MVGFLLLVRGWLPSSHFKLPKKKVCFCFFFLPFFPFRIFSRILVTYLKLLASVVLWGWTSISWCSTRRSSCRIWYTTRFSTLALLSRGSTVRNMESNRFLFSGLSGFPSSFWIFNMWWNVFLLQMIPVAANDVAFSIHAVVLIAFTWFQIAIYEVSDLFLLWSLNLCWFEVSVWSTSL